MAKKNFDGGLINIKTQEPLTDNGKPDGKQIIIRDILVDALLAPTQAEVKGKDKADRFKLACKINLGGEQDVSAEEIVLLKRLVGDLYGPLVVGQVYAVLDA